MDRNKCNHVIHYYTSQELLLHLSAVLFLGVFVVLAEAKPGNGNGGGGNGGNSPSKEVSLAFLRGQMSSFGLIDSFVEDQADYSYTYDNSLAAMAFLSSGDILSAGDILDAYLALGPEPAGGFLHRYATDGSSAAGLLRLGHNAYLLQAMNLYFLKTGNTKYNILAQTIADYILSLQDADGGLTGSISVTWKSTENNLGAYSGIHNLGSVQELPYYTSRAVSIRDFLITECWDGIRFLTGENDATISTDVQALGTMILGLDYANGTYWIEGETLTTMRLKGRKTVTGFDLNNDRDTVWSEGTLQQAVAYLSIGDSANAQIYKQEIENLYQSSGAILEASNIGTTGFGEMFQKWQAAAPTAWYIIISNQDNVLQILE